MGIEQIRQPLLAAIRMFNQHNVSIDGFEVRYSAQPGVVELVVLTPETALERIASQEIGLLQLETPGSDEGRKVALELYGIPEVHWLGRQVKGDGFNIYICSPRGSTDPEKQHHIGTEVNQIDMMLNTLAAFSINPNLFLANYMSKGSKQGLSGEAMADVESIGRFSESYPNACPTELPDLTYWHSKVHEGPAPERWKGTFQQAKDYTLTVVIPLGPSE